MPLATPWGVDNLEAVTGLVRFGASVEFWTTRFDRIPGFQKGQKYSALARVIGVMTI
jgi:hypothetical protein